MSKDKPTLNLPIACPRCGGRKTIVVRRWGRIKTKRCPRCKGTGTVK